MTDTKLKTELEKLIADLEVKVKPNQNNNTLIKELVELIIGHSLDGETREKLLLHFLIPYVKQRIANKHALSNFFTTHLNIKTRVRRVFRGDDGNIVNHKVKDYPTIHSVIIQSGDVPPSTNLDALSAWKNAWARLVAHTWRHWKWTSPQGESEEQTPTELDFIKLYPEYYLQQFGFDVNQWPQFRNAIKVVIHKNDTISYVNQDAIYIYRPTGKGETPPKTDFKDNKAWENVFVLPKPSEYLSAEPDVTLGVKSLVDQYNKRPDRTQSPIAFLKENFPWFEDNQARKNDTINEDGENRLRNGWDNNNWGYLMGMIVAPIPYPPRVPISGEDLYKINDAIDVYLKQRQGEVNYSESEEEEAIKKVRDIFGLSELEDDKKSTKGKSFRTTPEIVSIKYALPDPNELQNGINELVNGYKYKSSESKNAKLTEHEAIALTDYMQMVHNQPFSTDAC
ncbi:MAG TPA: hypothetical protein DCS93_25625 [Microscillaceae bacterium]|nr:hypothetical protein [Microscillaceae bacterium]